MFVANEARIGASGLSGYATAVSGNRFERNTASHEAAAARIVAVPSTRVVHNLFLGNQTPRGAIALVVEWGVVSNNLFVGNRCERLPGLGGCSAAVWVPDGMPDVRNNTFIDNTGGEGPAHLAFDSMFGQVRSNLFVGGEGPSAIGMAYTDHAVSGSMTYNAWWRVPVPVWGPGVTPGVGNLEADPLFSGATEDWRLGVGSACIDAGDPDPLLRDADGSRSDIGAFGGPEGDWVPLADGGEP